MAGHVTTQNLGGKKPVGREGWQSVLIVAVTKFLGSNPRAVAKNYLLYWGSKLNFTDDKWCIIPVVAII